MPVADPTIRIATVDDAEAIRSIYNVEVESSTVTFDIIARTPDEQRRWIVDRTGAHVVIVAIDGDTVVGLRFAVAVPITTGVRHHRRGLRLRASRPPGPRASVGRSCPSWSTGSTTHGFHAMVGRIVGGHDASIGLHRALGFDLVGHEREVGRKFGRWLDVVVMELLLCCTRPVPARLRAVRLTANRVSRPRGCGGLTMVGREGFEPP